MPDEGDILSDEGIGRIDGWVGLCHLRFVLEVVSKGEGGRWEVGCQAQCSHPSFKLEL